MALCAICGMFEEPGHVCPEWQSVLKETSTMDDPIGFTMPGERTVLVEALQKQQAALDRIAAALEALVEQRKPKGTF